MLSLDYDLSLVAMFIFVIISLWRLIHKVDKHKEKFIESKKTLNNLNLS